MPRATFLLAIICLPLAAAAQVVSPDMLKRYVAELQKTPDDMTLRERIIASAHAMNPAPKIPEDAERFMARGAAASKGARNADDFKDAAAEFEKASLAAPWLAEAYYNLGVVQDNPDRTMRRSGT